MNSLTCMMLQTPQILLCPSVQTVPLNREPPCVTLGAAGPRMGPGRDKIGAAVGEVGLCLSRSVSWDGRRSLEEAGPLFVRIPAGRNKGSCSSNR